MDEEAQAIAARLVRRLKEFDFKLTVAESCTGGLLTSILTDIAGASQWFEQSWVTYSNESKTNELNVEPELVPTRHDLNAGAHLQKIQNTSFLRMNVC